MTSTGEQLRRDVYDQAVAALHRIDPDAVPVAQYGDAFAASRVGDQARHTTPPPAREPSPEGMLMSRVSNMQNAISKLVAEAKRKGVPIAPIPEMPADLGARLQLLNKIHFALEKRIDYFDATTPNDRAITELKNEVANLKKAFLAQDVLLKQLLAKT